MMSLHDIHLPAAAFGADQPLAPVEHGRFGAVPSSHINGIGLDLMLAFRAPNDQPDAGGGSDGSKDVFVHISAVERASMGNLHEGQRISYQLERGLQGKTSAVDLQAA
jgi:cold shock CspA family protein